MYTRDCHIKLIFILIYYQNFYILYFNYKIYYLAILDSYILFILNIYIIILVYIINIKLILILLHIYINN